MCHHHKNGLTCGEREMSNKEKDRVTEELLPFQIGELI